MLRADEVACIDIRVCEILHVRDYLLVRGSISVIIIVVWYMFQSIRRRRRLPHRVRGTQEYYHQYACVG